MKNTFKKTIILFILTSSYSMADVSGKVIAYACYSCHGEHLTQLALPIPLSASHLTRTLIAFKMDKNNSIMNRVTKGFTDNELKAVATYISGLD